MANAYNKFKSVQRTLRHLRTYLTEHEGTEKLVQELDKAIALTHEYDKYWGWSAARNAGRKEERKRKV